MDGLLSRFKVHGVCVCVCVCVPAGPPVHMEHLVRRYAARQQWPERRTAELVCPCE